jgi:hypothetical protein
MQEVRRTYIHGSVDDLCPGAKTPRPYPRTETTHGSLCVSLEKCQRQMTSKTSKLLTNA